MYVAAKLAIADHLADGPRPVSELAELTGSNESALYRFCRVLASLDVLVALKGRTYGLGRLGEPLRTDVPGSMRYSLIMLGEESFRAWTDVLHTARTGEPAFDHVYGMSYYQYLAQNPEASETFNQAMGADRPPAVLNQCDFSGCGTIVDLGGGIGTVLAAILQRNPDARGVLVDLPDCVEEARPYLEQVGLADRCKLVGADFFDFVPDHGDAYVLSRVLHNWDDSDAVRLLRGVRRAMDAGDRLIIVDHLLPETTGFHPGLLADLHMLVVLGARERTESEMRELLDAAGLRMSRVLHGPGDDPRAQSAIEAVLTEE